MAVRKALPMKTYPDENKAMKRKGDFIMRNISILLAAALAAGTANLQAEQPAVPATPCMG